MLKVIFLYLMVSAAIAGLLYGRQATKSIAIKHKWRAAFAFSLGLFLVIGMYFLEIRA